MKTKYIIITIVVIAILIVSLMLLQNYKNVNNQKSESVSNQPIAQLPVTEYQESAIQIEKSDDPAQIKDSFEKYVAQNVDENPAYKRNGISQVYPVYDQNGKEISLDIVLNSIGAKINPKIRNLIGGKFYGFFYCQTEAGKRGYGVTFELENIDPQKLKMVNSEVKEYMRQWEPFILKDLKNILFPKEFFDEAQASQPLEFKDGQFCYAEVILPSGEKSSINYTVDIYPPDHPSSENRIYIATSPECLDKSLGYLFDF
jgi:competence protein ComGC